jgi:hypothetical protein
MAPMRTSVAEKWQRWRVGTGGQRARAHSILIYHLPDLPKGD